MFGEQLQFFSFERNQNWHLKRAFFEIALFRTVSMVFQNLLEHWHKILHIHIVLI